jgi:hypothetical protein
MNEEQQQEDERATWNERIHRIPNSTLTHTHSLTHTHTHAHALKKEQSSFPLLSAILRVKKGIVIGLS